MVVVLCGVVVVVVWCGGDDVSCGGGDVWCGGGDW